MICKCGLKLRKSLNDHEKRFFPVLATKKLKLYLPKYRAGMPLALLSEWLGHENPETSLIYAYADTEMKRDAIQKATVSNNPMNIEKIQPFWKNDDEMIRQLYGLK